jgi:hypothetical protein
MITPNAYKLFDVLIDEYGTGEVSRENKGHWLNLAIRDFIEDRINPKQDAKGYSFQSDNRVRNELKELYVGNTALSAVATRVYGYPANFKYPSTILVLTTTTSPKYVPAVIHSPAKATDADRDPFIDKGFEPFCEMLSTGIYVYSKEEDGSDISGVKLSYIKNWTEVSQTEATNAGSLDNTSGNIIYVETGNLTQGSTYSAGNTFTSNGAAITGSGTGSVITNAELNDTVIRECIRKAAYMYLVAMDQQAQAQALMLHEANS